MMKKIWCALVCVIILSCLIPLSVSATEFPYFDGNISFEIPDGWKSKLTNDGSLKYVNSSKSTITVSEEQKINPLTYEKLDEYLADSAENAIAPTEIRQLLVNDMSYFIVKFDDNTYNLQYFCSVNGKTISYRFEAADVDKYNNDVGGFYDLIDTAAYNTSVYSCSFACLNFPDGWAETNSDYMEYQNNDGSVISFGSIESYPGELSPDSIKKWYATPADSGMSYTVNVKETVINQTQYFIITSDDFPYYTAYFLTWDGQILSYSFQTDDAGKYKSDINDFYSVVNTAFYKSNSYDGEKVSFCLPSGWTLFEKDDGIFTYINRDNSTIYFYRSLWDWDELTTKSLREYFDAASCIVAKETINNIKYYNVTFEDEPACIYYFCKIDDTIMEFDFIADDETKYGSGFNDFYALLSSAQFFGESIDDEDLALSDVEVVVILTLFFGSILFWLIIIIVGNTRDRKKRRLLNQYVQYPYNQYGNPQYPYPGQQGYPQYPNGQYFQPQGQFPQQGMNPQYPYQHLGQAPLYQPPYPPYQQPAQQGQTPPQFIPGQPQAPLYTQPQQYSQNLDPQSWVQPERAAQQQNLQNHTSMQEPQNQPPNGIPESPESDK